MFSNPKKRNNTVTLTSPRPSITRTTTRATQLPLVACTTKGVTNVKMAVHNIPNPSEYLPPNRSAIIPPGI